MFLLLESVAWAIHGDRVRDLERAARDRRLLEGPVDTTRPIFPAATPVQRGASLTRPACGDSAGQPA